jgi:DNA polymerase delta subunit 1
MAARDITPTERAVLDGRQKALKLCSNALYGFTGAQASPMQALPLADSCLAMGAASCRRAVELVNGAFDNGKVRSHSCGVVRWHSWEGRVNGQV